MGTSLKLEQLMGLKSAPNPRAFIRAASQRLESATALVEWSKSSGAYRLDAVYLGGYCVECALKALILDRTPEPKRQAELERIGRGSQGHDLEILAKNLKLSKKVAIPGDTRVAVDFVARRWGTELRYRGEHVLGREVIPFLENVRAIHAWVERSLKS